MAPTRASRRSPVPPAPPTRPEARGRSQASAASAAPPVPRWRLPQRGQRIAAAFVLVVATCFFLALRHLAPTRSFHQDELTNIRMHTLRDRGIAAEEQHRTFHEFYAWWLEDNFSEAGARLPSTIATVASLLLLAALAGRLGGRRAAMASAVLYVCWPRAWDNGLEMRYYAVILCGALLGLHALLSLLRGRAVVWPFAVLAGTFVALRHWHPTAIPFHAALLAVAAFVAAWRATALVRTHLSDRTQPFPWRTFLPPALVLVAGACAGAWLAPRLAADLRLGRLLEAGEDAAPWSLNPMDLVRWLFGWVDDRLASPFPAVRLVRVGFVVLLAIGAWRLWHRHRSFALAGLFAFLTQVAAAAVVQHSWARLAVGYKYMSSSGALLHICLALGLAALVTWAWRQKMPQRLATLAAVALLYFVPLAPRLALSALGDGSHFRQAWTLIFARSGGSVPLVVGRSEFTQSEWGYRRLMDDFQAMVWREDEIGTAALPFLSVRRRPVFVAVAPDRAAAVEKTRRFEPIAEYRSNFTPTWDVRLYGKRGDVQVAAGGWADLRVGQTILVAETSAWELSGAARLDGWPSTSTVAEIPAGTLLTVTEAAPAARLLPDFRQPVIRQGAFAQKGEMDAWNRVVLREGGRGAYSLSNNYSIEYDLFLPQGPTILALETRVDEPKGGGFLLEIDGELAGLYALPDSMQPGTTAVYHMEIPAKFLGGGRTVTLTNLAENSARRADSPTVRVSTIESLAVLPLGEGMVVSPNMLATVTLAEPPPFAPGGRFDVGLLLQKNGFQLASEGNQGRLWVEGDRLFVTPASPSAYQNLFSPRWPVKPGTFLVPEIEVRTHNLKETNLVPVIHLYDAEGKTIRSDTFSSMPISRGDVDWVRRVGLVTAPENTAWATMMFYLNDSKGEPTPADAAFEFRTIRVGR